MIVQDFFSTDIYIPSNIDSKVELSNNVNALNLNYPNGWPDAYYYGWLKWENAPDILKVSNITCEGSDPFNKVVSANYGTPRNFNVGYIATGYLAYSQYWYGPLSQILYYGENNSVYADVINDLSPYLGSRFINKLDPRGVCPIHGGASAPGENKINFFVSFTYRHSGGAWNSFLVAYIPFGDVADGINKFLKGEITRNLSFSGSIYLYDNFNNAQSILPTSWFDYVLDINSPDFGVNYPNVWTYYIEQSGDVFEVNVFMCGYNFPVGADRISNNSDYEHQTMRVLPIVSQNLNGVDYKSVGFTGYTNVAKFINNNINSIPYDQGNTTIIDENTGMCYGGFNGTIDTGANPYNYCPTFDNDANFCVCPGYDNTTYVFRIMSVDEIMHSQTLNMRYCTNDDYTITSYGFGAGMFYPHISPENEYLCEWLTGEFDEIKDDLRPWQYGDITDNEYNPEDLPPYEPPKPIDDMYGDDITPPNFAGIGGTNGFITHYALTPSQMGRLGTALWAGVADNQFWDSIAVVLDNTLSINPADILNYIVAVRQYPMALQDTNACDILTLKDIYIGRGGYGLTVASDSDLLYHTIARMNRPVSLEYGGYLDIAPFYNDFRDFEPCTEITLHVPFCGSCKLAPSQVVGKQLIMQYSIDYTSGSITAICNVRGTKTYPVAVMHGQIGANIQMSASETMDNLQNVAAIGAGVATFALNPAAGTAVMAGNAVATSLSHNHAQGYSTGRSGGFSAFFEVRKPYVIITHDVYETPQNFAHVYGNATNCEKLLGDLHGYTECENVDVSGLTCTADDAAIIKRLLESGVYMD